ncbi:MAG: hypothetical protein WKG07_44300 [Hymenobacter sp.]
MRRTYLLNIVNRQNRIVHVLLVVSAVIGLAWVIWRHQYLAAQDAHQHAAKVAQREIGR